MGCVQFGKSALTNLSFSAGWDQGCSRIFIAPSCFFWKIS